MAIPLTSLLGYVGGNQLLGNPLGKLLDGSLLGSQATGAPTVNNTGLGLNDFRDRYQDSKVPGPFMGNTVPGNYNSKNLWQDQFKASGGFGMGNTGLNRQDSWNNLYGDGRNAKFGAPSGEPGTFYGGYSYGNDIRGTGPLAVGGNYMKGLDNNLEIANNAFTKDGFLGGLAKTLASPYAAIGDAMNTPPQWQDIVPDYDAFGMSKQFSNDFNNQFGRDTGTRASELAWRSQDGQVNTHYGTPAYSGNYNWNIGEKMANDKAYTGEQDISAYQDYWHENQFKGSDAYNNMMNVDPYGEDRGNTDWMGRSAADIRNNQLNEEAGISFSPDAPSINTNSSIGVTSANQIAANLSNPYSLSNMNSNQMSRLSDAYTQAVDVNNLGEATASLGGDSGYYSDGGTDFSGGSDTFSGGDSFFDGDAGTDMGSSDWDSSSDGFSW